jgi:hypothetical protein
MKYHPTQPGGRNPVVIRDEENAKLPMVKDIEEERKR